MYYIRGQKSLTFTDSFVKSFKSCRKGRRFRILKVSPNEDLSVLVNSAEEGLLVGVQEKGVPYVSSHVGTLEMVECFTGLVIHNTANLQRSFVKSYTGGDMSIFKLSYWPFSRGILKNCSKVLIV